MKKIAVIDDHRREDGVILREVILARLGTEVVAVLPESRQFNLNVVVQGHLTTRSVSVWLEDHHKMQRLLAGEPVQVPGGTLQLL